MSQQELDVKILAVDDSPISRDLLPVLFSSSGFPPFMSLKAEPPPWRSSATATSSSTA
ncbi:hypothetical protein [Ponticoccus litoralis]|uniref:Response regulatory domain-containing protein n=1 Tax=Ponticoccus litoralis TaxID=422297 RepID=A0AAW9SBG5_9RHOB